jgi:hypothetical protein
MEIISYGFVCLEKHTCDCFRVLQILDLVLGMDDGHRDVMSARYEMQTIYFGCVQELESRVLRGPSRQVPDGCKVRTSRDIGPGPTSTAARVRRIHARSQILEAVTLKGTLFWDVMFHYLGLQGIYLP